MKSTPLARLAFRTISISLAAFATINLAGCAAGLASMGIGNSPYQALGHVSRFGLLGQTTLGYSETRIADDQYTVYFKGVEDQVYPIMEKKIGTADEAMARLRAAELTLLQGYTHFVILSESVKTTFANYCNWNNECYDIPVAVLQIKLLKAADSSVPNALDAKSVIAELGPKYDPKKYPKPAK